MVNLTKMALNKFTIIGKLLDATFNEGKTKDGRTWNRANITVRVSQEYGGRTEVSEIPVSLFATQYTTQGAPHPGFKNIQDLKEMKTVQNYGEAEAAVVRMTNAQIGENMYLSRGGQVVDTWRLSTSFINEAGRMNDIASFNVEVFILDMHDEVDRDGDPTGRMIIKGGIVQYGGKLDVVEFVVEAADAVNYLQRTYSINDTVRLNGRVRWTSIEEKSSGSESSWGENIPTISTRMVRELVVTGGSDDPYEEEFAYDPTEIKKGFAARKAMMEQLQVDAKSTTQKPAASSASKYSWED